LGAISYSLSIHRGFVRLMGKAQPKRKRGPSPGYKAKLRCGKQGVAAGYGGEIGLVRAILDRALRDLRILDAKDECHGGKAWFEDAWEWMFNEAAETHEYGGFRWVLTRLDLEPWDLEFQQKAWQARLKRNWQIGMQESMRFASEPSASLPRLKRATKND
jgi:hypothetical protein